MTIEASTTTTVGRRLRLGMVGGGHGAFIGAVHRIAAIVMCLSSAYHLYYVIFTARGRQLVKDLWFRLKDARDLLDMLKYNLGMTPVKPRDIIAR